MDDIKDISSMLDTSFSFYIVAQNLSHATSTFKTGWETYLHIVAISFDKNQAPIVQIRSDQSLSHVRLFATP